MVDSFKYEILSEDYSKHDLIFKILFTGDIGVGRSVLLHKAINGIFDKNFLSTVGFEFYKFNIKVEDKAIKLQLWDTCGQEVYRGLITSYYRNASLVVISYAINNRESFIHINNWLHDAKSECNKECKFFLIGNKADLESERSVLKEEGEKFAKDNNFDFFAETSSKTGYNVQYILIQAAKILYFSYLENGKIVKKKEEKTDNEINKKQKLEENKYSKLMKYISY